MRYKSVFWLTAAILLLSAGPVFSQHSSETRVLEKSFRVNRDMALEVTNKYGKIHLSPGESDSVSIRIELNASAPTPSRLRNLIDGVSFELESTSYFVIASTRFERGPANLLESIRSLTNNLISSESSLRIDYYVTTPDYINIKIDNRYGDTYIESTGANLEIKSVNGDLKAEDLLGDTRFDLSFCNAKISSLKSSSVSLSYGEIEIARAGDIKVNSISSRVNIGSAENLSVSSKRDRFFINSLSSISGESYFTDFNLETLREKADITTRYGNIDIALVPSTFSLVSIESSYTGISMEFDQGASFSFDARLANSYSTIPDHWVLDERLLSSEKSEYLYSGNVGKKEGKGKVVLKMTRGKLAIGQK